MAVWIEEHARSLQFQSKAQAEERYGHRARARSFYCKAARCEVASINAMSETELARNLSSAIVDAVTFYWKGHDFDSAAKLWDAWGTSAHLTDWAKTTVEKLLSGKEQT